jgi:hypothetical protein
MSCSNSKPYLIPQFVGLVLCTAELCFWELRTLAKIKCLSSDHITICYIHKRFSIWNLFTSQSPICDSINIHWVTVKNAQLSLVRYNYSRKIDQIANWRMWDQQTSKTASFTYISYCDPIRTQIFNWRQSSEVAKIWNHPKNHRFGGV